MSCLGLSIIVYGDKIMTIVLKQNESILDEYKAKCLGVPLVAPGRSKCYEQFHPACPRIFFNLIDFSPRHLDSIPM